MPTFLFTDLESSTRLWESQPDAMRVALARHDSILRETVERSKGSIVKTTGDGLLAVFGSVADAVRATVGAQIALGEESWPTTDPLRVRMGIHYGDGELRDGDYFGPALNRAARIMAAGHGGQVLVSGAAASLVESELPDGVALRDLGSHRLKDLTVPEHLYQLVHTGLPGEFPTLATLDARPNNLPVQVSEFFGRESEVASIQAMLASPTTRLLTLVGTGGAGKTRLALQVAAEQLDAFPDGVFFVDLSVEKDSDAAFEAVVRTLGFPASGGGRPLDVLLSRLKGRRLLLVLDNFEQVTTAAAGVVTLVQHCPGVMVLVTSREALRVRGEHIFPVPALELPNRTAPVEEIAAAEAVKLFMDRARSVRPDFALTEDNAPVVAEICLRLDGLPLAIELAAARLNVFSPEDLMQRLRQRLDGLGAGGRDVPARQRTLWGAIGWSYELLDSRECRVFEMLAVFSASRLDALERVAASVLEGGLDLDTLAALVDKSLVRSVEDQGIRRFSMLQTIQQYATERLAESPEFERAVRQAHAEYFAAHAHDLAGNLRGENRAAALEQLDSAVDNLRTAWRYWVDRRDPDQVVPLVSSLWALYDAKGWYHAAIELAHDALGVITADGSSPEHIGDELTLRTSLARALMAVQGYSSEVEAAFGNALELAAATGEAAQVFPVLRALGTFYMSTSEFAQASELGRRMLALAEQEDDQSRRVDGHYLYGAATAFNGDLASGLAHLEQAIALFDPTLHGSGQFRLGSSPGVIARVVSGLLLWQSGSLDRAVGRVDEALTLARALGHPFTLAYALYHHGLLQFYRGRFPASEECARELAEVAAANDYPVWTTLAAVLEGVSLTGIGRVEEGLSLTESGVERYLGLTTPPVFWPLILGLRAWVISSAGSPEAGLQMIDEAIAIYGPNDVSAAEHRIVRGDILRLLKRPAEADATYQAAVHGARLGGLHLIELQAMTRLVDLRLETGIDPDGREELGTLLANFGEGHGEQAMQTAVRLLE